jgi:neural Wiskott-Aldrich syndrome protein
MMGIPMIAWALGAAGWYARDLMTPNGGQRPQPQAPPPPPQYLPPPQGYYPEGYAGPPAYAAPPPPRRRHCPFELDVRIDEQTDLAISCAIGSTPSAKGPADVATLQGFAQSIARVYPIAAGVLRMRAYQLAQAGQGGGEPVPLPPSRPIHSAVPQPAPSVPVGRDGKPLTRQQIENYNALVAEMAASGATAPAPIPVPPGMAAPVPAVTEPPAPPPPQPPVEAVAAPPVVPKRRRSKVSAHANGVKNGVKGAAVAASAAAHLPGAAVGQG